MTRGRKCAEGCQCGRHSSELRRKISEKARARGALSEEHKQKIGQSCKDMWAAMPEDRMKEISESRSVMAKQYWEGESLGVSRRKYGGRRTSRHEHALVPYMAALGYLHNSDGGLRIGRKVPDFIDMRGRRVFEYFGSYWHPDPAEEQLLIAHYATKGWACEVLWEQDLFKWLASHKELVKDEEHDHAWRAVHVNNGYRKPELETV